MLSIKNLHVSVKKNKILNGLNLDIKEGELHVVMGRNGSGKSTLANVISGKDNYIIDKGEVQYFKENLLDMEVEETKVESDNTVEYTNEELVAWKDETVEGLVLSPHGPS